MPWTVQRDKRCAPNRPWSVVVQGTNQLVACHPSRRKALRQAAALYANAPEAQRMSEPRAAWTTAYINNLPDSAFLYIAPGGKKDEEGKTVPRDLRMWPVHDSSGNVDLPHLRNALSRIPQSDAPDSAKAAATKKAEAMLKAAMKGRSLGKDGVETRVASEAWPEAGIEIRRQPDSMKIEGYAAVFGAKSLPLPFTESFRPGAFSRSLKERPVKMFLNHNDNIVLGYTKSGTLQVGEDSRGLSFEGNLPDNEWGRPVADAIDRGDIDNMSFTFKATRDTWANGYQEREVIDANLYEISPITAWAAYPATTIVRRSLQDLAAYLLADADALQTAIGKLANGEPLMCQEADLLEAAIEHLEPPDDEDESPMQMNAAPLPLLTEWRAKLAEKGLIAPEGPVQPA